MKNIPENPQKPLGFLARARRITHSLRRNNRWGVPACCLLQQERVFTTEQWILFPCTCCKRKEWNEVKRFDEIQVDSFLPFVSPAKKSAGSGIRKNVVSNAILATEWDETFLKMENSMKQPLFDNFYHSFSFDTMLENSFPSKDDAIYQRRLPNHPFQQSLGTSSFEQQQIFR